MIRDQYTTHTGTSLFTSWAEVEQTVVSFVDLHISGFIPLYKAQGSPTSENRITDLFSVYFNSCNQGYLPFFFEKNPTQQTGYRESDMGVFANDIEMNPLLPIFEFEAKKLPASATHEYVYGERGGMERFKREIHSPHLPHCGMLGYVLDKEPNYWMGQINNWITNLATQSPLNGIDWSGDDELLHPIGTTITFSKCKSRNKRVTLPGIVIFHYLIDLT